MTDLDLLAALGEETPPPTPAALAPARARLVAELRAAAAPPQSGPAHSGPGRGGVRGSRWRRRVVTAAAGVGLVAAATAAVATLGTTPRGDAPPPASAVADVLTRAAVAARAEPDVRPRADQFLHVRLRYAADTYEGWFSVDGTHDGLVRPAGGPATPLAGCRDGRAPVVRDDRIDPALTEPCVPDPAYLPDLPTTADGMLAYVREAAGGGKTNSLAKEVAVLASQKLLRPAARAALFEAARRIPGITQVPDARDGAGRPGVGVSWTHEGGGPTTLVFDRTTYEYLGSADESLQQQVVVDRPGQRG